MSRPAPPCEAVVAAIPQKLILAALATQDIALGIALEVVGPGSADQALDTVELVALGVPILRQEVPEIHPHALARAPVAGEVEPAAPEQLIGPRPALENVVATEADQGVVAGEATDLVRPVGSFKIVGE